MNLVYFTQEAYRELKKDIENNRDKYLSSKMAWIQEYFDEKKITEYRKESSITVPIISLRYSGDETEKKNFDDLSNVMLLYTGYKDKISPLQASDPCLWSALCHFEFSDYIMKRWKKDGEVSLEKRFFATEGRSSLCYYNAISRLWWSGYLTYDEEKRKSDPWELTRVLFSAQQIQKDLFDQPFSMNRTIVKGLLRALKRIQETTGNNSTPIFRTCCNSYLNRYGAVAILDALSAEEIEAIAFNYMNSKTAVID